MTKKQEQASGVFFPYFRALRHKHGYNKQEKSLKQMINKVFQIPVWYTAKADNLNYLGCEEGTRQFYVLFKQKK